MELKAEIRIRNKETGAETILCTNVTLDNAIRWLNFSWQSMDFNAMPEYIIKPVISKTVVVKTAPAQK